MGYATSQQLARYYELYQNIDVTFSKEVIKATGLIPQQVYVKALGGQWPCVLNSASLSGAKIIAGIKSGFYEKIQQGNTSVSLRLSFQDPEKSEPMSFFVTSKITGFTQYAGSPDLIIINIAYTQRPPDDLIEKLGALLEANINSTKRREERIVMTPDAMRKLGILQKETVIFIQGIPRRCIIRDLSFSGSKVIMVGIAPFLINKEVVLRIDIAEPRMALGVKGTIVRTEDVEGRKDLVALAIKYHETEIPMGYKMQINAYLSQLRKTALHDAAATDGANAPKHAHEGHANKEDKADKAAEANKVEESAEGSVEATAEETPAPETETRQEATATQAADAAPAKK